MKATSVPLQKASENGGQTHSHCVLLLSALRNNPRFGQESGYDFSLSARFPGTDWLTKKAEIKGLHHPACYTDSFLMPGIGE
jgi:hypothetical protein